jgi:protein associated with RNAse G/E
MQKKRSKYNAKRTEYNGFVYDSIKEAGYAKKLDLLKMAKGKDKVLSVERQVPYEMIVNDVKICTYRLDFKVTYSDRVEHVDVKGVLTAIYKLKKKLMKACHGIDIIEV